MIGSDLIKNINAERAGWHALLAEIGEERMGQPGAMGAWTFKDLVAHLTAWRGRTLARIEAGPDAEPAPPWPQHLTEDDQINAWVYERNRDRPLQQVLAEADRSFERLARAIAMLSDEDLTTPGRFAWMDGKALIDGAFFGHFHDEHEPAIRAWLARQTA